MPNYEKLTENLTRRGYTVRRFAAAQQAADYLDSVIDQTSVAFGGSVTLDQLDLYPRLSAHNRCLWHWKGDDRMDGMQTEVYLSSVNGLAETGELINIDGRGNRVSATLARHQRVYFVVGRNKIRPDFSGALHRARNIAGPKNAVRLKLNTPGAVRGDRCYDCQSPDRICRALAVLWAAPTGVGTTEVVLIDQDLGF